MFLSAWPHVGGAFGGGLSGLIGGGRPLVTEATPSAVLSQPWHPVVLQDISVDVCNKRIMTVHMTSQTNSQPEEVECTKDLGHAKSALNLHLTVHTFCSHQ